MVGKIKFQISHLFILVPKFYFIFCIKSRVEGPTTADFQHSTLSMQNLELMWQLKLTFFSQEVLLYFKNVKKLSHHCKKKKTE